MCIHACEDGKPNWLTSRVQEFKTIPFAAKYKKETVNAAGCSSGWAPTRLSPSISPLKSSCPFFSFFFRPPSMFLIRFFGSPCKKKKKKNVFTIFVSLFVWEWWCHPLVEIAKKTRRRETQDKKTIRLSPCLAQSVVAQISSGSKEKSSNFFFLFQ